MYIKNSHAVTHGMCSWFALPSTGGGHNYTLCVLFFLFSPSKVIEFIESEGIETLHSLNAIKQS